MKIGNDLTTNLLHKGVVETARKNLKEMAVTVNEDSVKQVDKKVFKNPEPSSLKGFKIDKLA